jgi:hypothetical protein
MQWLAADGITSSNVLKLGPIALVPQATVNALNLAQNGYTQRDGGRGFYLSTNPAMAATSCPRSPAAGMSNS